MKRDLTWLAFAAALFILGATQRSCSNDAAVEAAESKVRHAQEQVAEAHTARLQAERDTRAVAVEAARQIGRANAEIGRSEQAASQAGSEAARLRGVLAARLSEPDVSLLDSLEHAHVVEKRELRQIIGAKDKIIAAMDAKAKADSTLIAKLYGEVDALTLAGTVKNALIDELSRGRGLNIFGLRIKGRCGATVAGGVSLTGGGVDVVAGLGCSVG